MRISRILAVLLGVASALVAGCLGTGEDRVLGVEASGTVAGFVYFDANGSRVPDANDPPLADVGLRLVASGTRDTIARASSAGDGLFRLPRVPVGSYEIVVDPGTVDDSLQVVGVDNPNFTLTPDDSVSVQVAVSFPKVTVAEARALAPGERVFVEGVALNAWETFGDLTVHLADLSGAIRGTRVRPAVIIPGDGVRFQGLIGIADGQPTLEDVTPFVVGVVGLPPAQRLTTAAAATAADGILDAALVNVASATIVSTASVAGDLLLTVNDGSGALIVLLDKDVLFTDLSPFVPGAVIDARGLLVPDGSGRWRLKPRGDDDLVVR
ncbi:MAG: hypothetical protein JSU87_03425 [Gemmatimonadota bacterium]|nr:MAG: hypothetical protein JSU87_03425 [Gemmatimonadota bacterium]